MFYLGNSVSHMLYLYPYDFATCQASRFVSSEAIVVLHFCFCLMNSLIVVLMSIACKSVYTELWVYNVFINFTCFDRNTWFSDSKQL